MSAAGPGIECIDASAGAAGENRAIEHRRRGEGGNVAGESEGPFELQVAHLADIDAGLFRGHVTRIVERRAPAIPVARGRAGNGSVTGGAGVRECRRFAAGDSQEIGDGFTFVAFQRIGDVHHQAKVERPQDPGGGQFP